MGNQAIVADLNRAEVAAGKADRSNDKDIGKLCVYILINNTYLASSHPRTHRPDGQFKKDHRPELHIKM